MMLIKLFILSLIILFALAMKAFFGQSVETTLLIFVLSFLMIGENEVKR